MELRVNLMRKNLKPLLALAVIGLALMCLAAVVSSSAQAAVPPAVPQTAVPSTGTRTVDETTLTLPETGTAAGTPIRVGALLCAMRQEDRWGEVAGLVVRYRDAGVVGFDLAGPELEHRLGPIEGLDLGLLIDRQDDRPLGRGEVEPDDVGHLGDELRIAAELERLGLVGLEVEGELARGAVLAHHRVVLLELELFRRVLAVLLGGVIPALALGALQAN